MSPAALRLNSLLLPLTLAALACQETTAPQSDASPRYDVTSAACDIDSDWCDLADVGGSLRITLNGFDSDALTLTGVNKKGATVSVQLTIGTAFKPSLPPNPIFPNDPLLPPNPVLPPSPIVEGLLLDYDAALGADLNSDGSLIYSVISNLAAAQVPARIWIDRTTGVVKAFRPMN